MQRVLNLWLAPAVLCLCACSPAPTPVSQSPQDPSSPKAAEVAWRDVGNAARPAEPEGHAEEHHHHENKDAVYVCPMHPEITSNRPDVCPKCNMKLVPKE